jgi:DNA-binding IclR family transcriptional regulator
VNTAEADICENNHKGNPESVAANTVTEKQRDRRFVILSLHKRGPHGATCDELEVASGMSHQTCSARCSELLKIGWITRKPLGASYEKRKTRTGRAAAVLVHYSFRNAV